METWIVNGITWLAFYVAGYVVSHKKSKAQVKILEEKLSNFERIEQRERELEIKERNRDLFTTSVYLEAEREVSNALKDALRTRSS